MSLDARVTLPFLVLLLCTSLALAPAARAQDPIRVQSDEVLVPTVVFDKELYAQLNKMKPHHRDFYGRLVAKNEKQWDAIAVKNLTRKDFHLFEDEQEQKIQTVRLEPAAFRIVQDNLGKHPETIGIGGGIWAYPDRPAADHTNWLGWPQYVIAYVPPRSPAGSCHQIQVKVNSKKLEVWTRSEYCNTPHPATDPLNGTEFGDKLEAAARSAKDATLDLAARVTAFPERAAPARVYLSMSFPGQSLKHEMRNGTLFATIGSLVMVYRDDGTLAARYSDFACCDYGNAQTTPANTTTASSPSSESSGLIPDRYQTQFQLPAGQYNIRVILSDGQNFGVQQLPLTVQQYDPGQLSLSDMTLSRRVRALSANEAQNSNQSYAPLISKDAEFVPASKAQFWPTDMLFVYFEIDDPLVAGQPRTKVQADMRTVDTKSGAVVDSFAPVDTATYAHAGSSLIAVGRGVPLNRLPPGDYRLEVQASNAQGKTTPWRSADFTVIAAPPLEIGKIPPAP